MGIFSFFNRLHRSESGNVMMISAGLMPLLMGSAALAIDATQLALWKRQLQRAADSSAIAGAYALTQNANFNAVQTSVNNDIGENPTPPLMTLPVVPVVGAAAGFDSTVTVSLISQRTLPFANIFTNTPTTIAADATAAIVGQGDYCMISLFDGTGVGIDINGNSEVLLRCGAMSNCEGESCVESGGTSSLTADPIGSVGGLRGSSQNFEGETKLLPYSAPQADPLAYISNPVVPSSCTGTLDIGNGEVRSVKATECYASWNIGNGGTLLLEPGVHMINGGDITIHGNVTSVADPVTGARAGNSIVMTGPGGAAGDLKINAGATLDLKSPTSGEYKGVAFYRDRRASNIEIKINGHASSVLEGAFYAPSSDITFAGGAGMDVRCLQMIGWRLKFRGNAAITNECPPGSGGSTFSRRVVRLVE